MFPFQICFIFRMSMTSYIHNGKLNVLRSIQHKGHSTLKMDKYGLYLVSLVNAFF